jgi:hypothetical protein
MRLGAESDVEERPSVCAAFTASESVKGTVVCAAILSLAEKRSASVVMTKSRGQLFIITPLSLLAWQSTEVFKDRFCADAPSFRELVSDVGLFLNHAGVRPLLSVFFQSSLISTGRSLLKHSFQVNGF